MHAKVTIASLVFGLAVGFTASIGSNHNAINSKEENMVCNNHNHEHVELPSSLRKAAVKDFPMAAETRATHTHLYSTFEYLNDGRHRAICSCGATTTQEHVFDGFYPYGHGHNDMIHCALCNANIETTPIYYGDSISGSVASSEAKWYMFVAQGTDTYVFETTGSSDPYGDLYVGECPTAITTSNDDGGANRNFKITYTLSYGQRAFLRVRGYNWNSASYTLTIHGTHVHNYNQLVQYNSQQHKRVCSCGDYYLEDHSYGSWQSYNNAFHRKTCACGHYIEEEHSFSAYLPYGHGHNDLIYCDECQTSIECARLEEGYPISKYLENWDADWYIFIPQESAAYTFETTGNTDTYGTLYIGDYPTGTPIENDDDGEGNNFKITAYLNVGEIAFLRVSGYDWYHYGNYTVSVVYESNTMPPQPMRDWTIMIYMCGSNTLTYAALEDIQEILSVNGKPNDVNIILEVGGATYWPSNGYGLQSGSLKRYYVSNNALIQCPGDDPVGNMGEQSTFEAFLNWGLTTYPANKTGVILWNHGGALDGVCYDNNYGMDSLLNSEVNAAFDNVFANNNITSKLEFIGYDACLMQMQDVAEFNSEHFKYMVGSEELEGGDGWEYDKWIDNLYRKESTTSILIEIADTYVQYSGCDDEGTLSVLDLTKMENYYREFEILASDMADAVENDFGEFLNVIENTKSFCYGCHEDTGAIDAFDFLINLENNSYFSPFYGQIYRVKQYFQQLMLYSANQSGAMEASGLTLHVCIDDCQTYPMEETHFYNWRHLFGLHNFTYYTYVTQNLHVKVCDCGYYEMEEHTIDNEWWENGHLHCHCSVCDANFMVQ